MEESKLQLIEIQFECNNYKKVNTNMRNKDFMFCCDLLKLKEYKEFEKLVKDKYFIMDNSIMVIETIDSDNVEHFKYILDYIEIKNLEQVLKYCCRFGKFNIVDYLIDNNKDFNNYQRYCELSASKGLYLIKKYYDVIAFTSTLMLYRWHGLDELRWLRGYRKTNNIWKLDPNAKICKWDPVLFGFILGVNKLDAIKWMRGYRKTNNIWKLDPKVEVCPWNTQSFNLMLCRTNLDIIRWVRGYRKLNNVWKFNRKVEVCPWKSISMNIDFNILKWLRGYREINNVWKLDLTARVCPWNKMTIGYLSKSKNLDKIKWVRGYRNINNVWKLDPHVSICPWSEEVLTWITDIGNFNFIRWVLGYRIYQDNIWKLDPNAKVCPWDGNVIKMAAKHNNFDLVKWLRGYRKKNNIWKLDPNVRVCPWESSNKREYTPPLHGAIDSCNFNIIRWMRGFRRYSENNNSNIWKLDTNVSICPWGGDISFTNAIFGNICNHDKNTADIVEWIVDQGCSFNSDSFEHVSDNTDPENLTLLMTNKTIWNINTINRIAKNDIFSEVKWFRGYRKIFIDNVSCGWKLDPKEPVCPWNGWTLNQVILKGNLGNVKWMRGYRENKLDPNVEVCPWNEWTFNCAILSDNIEIIKCIKGYKNNILDKNVPVCPHDNQIFKFAKIKNNKVIIEWLENHLR